MSTTGLGLQLQVKAQRVVEVRHDVRGDPTENCAEPLDGNGADPLGLGFGVLLQAGHGCRQQRLEALGTERSGRCCSSPAPR